MPPNPVNHAWRYGMKRFVPSSTNYTLAYAEAYIARTPEARTLVERGRTSFTELVAPPGLTLKHLATTTLGAPHMWMVLAVLNREIDGLVGDPLRAVPAGVVLRIPTPEATPTNECRSSESQLPPKEHASAYASQHAVPMQQPTEHRASSPLQTICNARNERARQRADLCARIVATFDLMVREGAPMSILGLEEARAVMAAPQNVCPPDLVRAARELLRDPDAATLATWTSPAAPNGKEAYVRAASLMSMRGVVSWLCDQVLAHFDDIAHGKPSLPREALAAWAPCAHILTRKLGTAGDVVPQTDLLSIMVQASNNEGHTGDVVTREGVLRLQALVNGKSLPQ